MKYFTTLAFAASIALTSAQATFNQTTGKYNCAKPNAAYCVGNSNIIIRCDANGVGQPGNCNDNLVGEFPFGVNTSPCYETSPTSGEAACSKNCIVYGASGTINGTFSIPGCIPSTTQSTSASATSTTFASSSVPLTTVTYTTVTVPRNTTSSQSIPLSTHVPPPPTTSPNSSGSGPTPISNSTTSTGGNGGHGGSPTATPVGPTTTSPAVFTGAAVANKAGAVLAAAGFLAAALL